MQQRRTQGRSTTRGTRAKTRQQARHQSQRGNTRNRSQQQVRSKAQNRSMPAQANDPRRATQQQLAPDRRKHARRPQRRPNSKPQSFNARSRGAFASLAISLIAVSLTMVIIANESYPLPEPVVRAIDIVPETVNTHIEDVDALFTSPYNWDNLRVLSNDRYAYIKNREILSRTGIDVSEHQQTIDWQRVAADDIDFAIIRIGYRGIGTNVVTKDATFDYNLAAARDAGLDVGVYFYSLANTPEEALEEAEFVVNQLAGTSLEYPVVFDMEPTDGSTERLEGLNKDQMTAIAQAFCEYVETAGYHACIYGNQTDLSRYHLMRLAQYGFWYAQYGSEPTMSLQFALWQYTQQGSVDGIEGMVDLDLDLTAILNGDY